MGSGIRWLAENFVQGQQLASGAGIHSDWWVRLQHKLLNTPSAQLDPRKTTKIHRRADQDHDTWAEPAVTKAADGAHDGG